MIDQVIADESDILSDRIQNIVAIKEDCCKQVFTGCVFTVAIVLDGVSFEGFLGKQKQLFCIGFRANIQIDKIDPSNFLVLDRLLEDHVVQYPCDAVRENNPINALIRGIVDSLLDVAFIEIDAYRLNLDQELQLPVNLNREIAVRSTDCMLAGDVGIFIVPKSVTEDVLDNSDGVGF